MASNFFDSIIANATKPISYEQLMSGSTLFPTGVKTNTAPVPISSGTPSTYSPGPLLTPQNVNSIPNTFTSGFSSVLNNQTGAQPSGATGDYYTSRYGGVPQQPAPVQQPAPATQQGPTKQSAAPAQLPPPPNIPNPEEAKILSSLAAFSNGGNLNTFQPSDLASGQKTAYQNMLEQAMQYYLGYDTSPEAKRLLELQTNLGKLQGAQTQSLAQIETTPGLTSFQSGRRQQALAQAAGGVTEPLIAEINAITGRQEAAQKRMTSALGVAEMLKPSTLGAPIIDEQGNATIVTSDPMTGGYHTINLGKLGSAKPASSDIAEYEYAKQNGQFNGSFLQFLAQKTSATTKASTTGGSSGDLTTLAQSVLDNPELFNQLTPTLKGKIAPLLARVGFTGFGKSLSDGALLKINDTKTGIRELGNIGVEAENLKAYTGPLAGLISQIPGTQTQKLRAGIDRVRQIVGKALEGGVLRKEDEEKYMRILPAITDLPSVVAYKIQQVTAQMENDMNSYISLQAGAGRDTSGVQTSQQNSYAPGTILTNASGQKGRVEADGSITIIQ